MHKIITFIGVFLAILLALTYGEAISHFMWLWLSWLTGMVIHNFSDLYAAIRTYLSNHTNKVILAFILTIPVSYWLLRGQDRDDRRASAQRKTAILLALFLGWLGAHRFYLGQIVWGLVYLIIWALFTPLAIVLGLIDSIRYFFTSNDDFAWRYSRQSPNRDQPEHDPEQQQPG